MDLKELRQKAGLRAEDVATSLGVVYSTVRNWEQGRTVPTLGILQTEKLIHLYQCSFEDLVQAVKQVQNTQQSILNSCEGIKKYEAIRSAV